MVTGDSPHNSILFHASSNKGAWNGREKWGSSPEIISRDAITKSKVSSLNWRWYLTFRDRIFYGDDSLLFVIASLEMVQKTGYHLHGDGNIAFTGIISKAWKPCIHLQRWYFENSSTISVKVPEMMAWKTGYHLLGDDACESMLPSPWRW